MAPAVKEELPEAVAIVDPYASGRYLVDSLRQLGCPVIAVRSCLTLPQHLMGTWNPSPFERIIVHHGDIAETLKKLTEGQAVRSVAAGCETGVALADELASALGLRGNDPQLAACRLHRQLTQERLLERGLRCCKQQPCASQEEARALTVDASGDSASSSLAGRPLVVKPCQSPGYGDVLRVKQGDEKALAAAVQRVLGTKDVYGNANSVALLQEFIEGSEYIVECVSLDSRHFVCAMWVRKRAPGYGPDRIEAVRFQGGKGTWQQVIHEYVMQCLDALGISNGASTSKVIFSETDGPCLVDIGAHLHSGFVGTGLWGRCSGRKDLAQAPLLADLLAADGREVLLPRLAAVESGAPAYEMTEFFVQVELRCPTKGVLNETIEKTSGDFIRALPSYYSLRTFVEDGDPVESTRDLCTSPGYVILLASGQEAAEADVRALRARELAGEMYAIRGETKAEEPALPGYVALRTLAGASRQHDQGKFGERLLSPLVSRAASPILSPLREPQLPDGPEDFVEFSLDCDDGELDGTA